MLIGGGVGMGLLIGWAAWPRDFEPNVPVAQGETLFNPFLKIGPLGEIIVVVPQAELGQGVFTALAQIVADQLGADWRTVGIEPSPISPLYANKVVAEEAAEAGIPPVFSGIATSLAGEYATRSGLMLTGWSSSVRAFFGPCREAGAAARTLLMQAAAKRWGVDWTTCETDKGFVLYGKDQRVKFGEVAADAALEIVPDPLPFRSKGERLIATSLPRLDIPAKVDGTTNYAGDIRLPDMLFASIRQGPIRTNSHEPLDISATKKIRGLAGIVQADGWIAAAAKTWWAADRALWALAPEFQAPDIDDDTVSAALDEAMESGNPERLAENGDADSLLKGKGIITHNYAVGFAHHIAMETPAATADVTDGGVRIWASAQAPSLMRADVAAALGVDEHYVTLYPVMAGGSFGQRLENPAAVQAAIISRELRRPVQLMWSRTEDLIRDVLRPPARAAMSARLNANGIEAWRSRIATPDSAREQAVRIFGNAPGARFATHIAGGSGSATAGGVPPYSVPNFSLDHVAADIAVPTGQWRSRAHYHTTFFTESFVDELAIAAKADPFSFRMQMLSGQERLAHCLNSVTALANWQGGGAGSGQGIAIHSMVGSHVAMVVDAHVSDDGAIAVTRVSAAVDCGQIINPDLVRQQIEGGILFGIAAAVSEPVRIENALPVPRSIAGLRLPRMDAAPEIAVQLIPSREPAGGVSEIAVPLVAPALANALFASTGRRYRSLPFDAGSGDEA